MPDKPGIKNLYELAIIQAKKLQLVLILVLMFHQTFSQLSKDKALYNYKSGLIFESKTLFIPEKDYFLYENYSYGGGFFFESPYRDTLFYKTDYYISKNLKLYKKNEKYYLVDNKGKQVKINFKEVDLCSPEINFTRNWTYKEMLRYKLDDTIRKCFGSFCKNFDYGDKDFCANDLCLKYCNNEFIYITDSLYQLSLNLITSEYARRAKRYSDFHNSKVNINSDFVDRFLKDFISCRYDQNIFYELILNNVELLVSRINLLSESEYQELTMQIIGMPNDFNSKIAYQKISDSKRYCIYKEKLLKDIKTYW